MGLILALLCMLIPSAFAQDKPPEIDPNTKIQGGADAPDARIERRDGTRLEERGDVARAERDRAEKDRPVSARKPSEPRPEDDATRGETAGETAGETKLRQ